MRGRALLDALVSLAAKRNISVRREPMSRGTSAGGLCVLKGVPTVFVDERAAVDAQVEVLASALRRFTWAPEEIPDGVHAALAPRRRPGREAPAVVITSEAPASASSAPPSEASGRG